MAVGTVCELWRYPVKSMLGEKRRVLNVDERGVVGDRFWAVYDGDGKLGSGKNTRRFRRMDGLFRFAAAYPDGETATPSVRPPNGDIHSCDSPEAQQALREILGLPVRLKREGATPHLDSSPIHLVTTAALARMRNLLPDVSIDERRFRPNLVIAVDSEGDGPAEDHIEDTWIGRELVIGDARLAVVERTERCVMVNNSQGDLEHDSRLLKAVTRDNELCLGVYAEVRTPGVIGHGAPVEIV